MAPKRQKKTDDVWSRAIYAEVNRALKLNVKKGATVYRMTEARADKVIAFVIEHPLQDPSKTPPDQWCRELIDELCNGNWQMSVKDVKTWYKYLPDLFKPVGEASSSVESGFLPVWTSGGNSAAPFTEDDDIQVIRIIQRVVSAARTFRCRYGGTHELNTDDEAPSSEVTTGEFRAGPPTLEPMDHQANELESLPNQQPGNQTYTPLLITIDEDEETVASPSPEIACVDPSPPPAHPLINEGIPAPPPGRLTEAEARSVFQFLERNNGGDSPEFRQLRERYQAFKEQFNLCWMASSARETYASHVNGYDNCACVLQVVDWFIAQLCPF